MGEYGSTWILGKMSGFVQQAFVVACTPLHKASVTPPWIAEGECFWSGCVLKKLRDTL